MTDLLKKTSIYTHFSAIYIYCLNLKFIFPFQMYIQRNAIAGFDTSIIEINDCAKLRFGPNAVSDLRNLRKVSVNNIGSVTFEQNSLNWYGYRDININQEERFDLSIPSLKISIRDSTVKSVGSQTFSGRINEILFEHVTIDTIDAFALQI